MKKVLTLTALFLFCLAVWTPAANAETHSNSSKRGKNRPNVRRHKDSRSDTHRRSPRDTHRGKRQKRLVKKWVPGRFVIEIKTVWHSGYYVNEVLPAVYEERVVIVTDPVTGKSWRETRMICIEPERIIRRWVRGWWGTVRVRVYLPGYWITVYV